MSCDRILVTAKQLESVVSGLAEEIAAAYRNLDNIVALVMLDGARYFAKDLLANLDFPVEVVFIKASSYGSRTSSCGRVRIGASADLTNQIRGKHVLVIDDIYDTGLTLATLLNRLRDYQPQSIRTCVLLEKAIEHTQKIPIDFRGLIIEDAFVIGYGLDFDGRYRDLPFIASFSPKHACSAKNAHGA
ncbi:MAG: hypoxanthine phosphoribosyltransferase [Planctomycetales bacterium]|nr:hypoxanthine phosphoribosyltransferase [Planctomycetales bacterium]